MTVLRSIARVLVPASTSNIGPGFDCLGCAFQLRNEFRVQVQPAGAAPSMVFRGPEAGRLAAGPDSLFFRAAARVFAVLGREFPVLAVEALVNVPNARGLGSSATAIVGGLVAANHIAGSPLPPDQILRLATEIEGHPDNVTPALLGGLTASLKLDSGEVIVARWLPSARFSFLTLLPEYKVATRSARKVLPSRVPLADATANASRLPLLVDALVNGRGEHLADLTRDRLHEPYRQSLYQRFAELKAAALEAGAHSVNVSGAGPAMLAIVPRNHAETIAARWEAAMTGLGIAGRVRILCPDENGARIVD